MTVSSSIVDVEGRPVKRISTTEYQAFLRDYWKNNKNGRPLRLGQAFINKFYPKVIMPSLFYERENSKAAYTIWQEFIDRDSHITDGEESL